MNSIELSIETADPLLIDQIHPSDGRSSPGVPSDEPPSAIGRSPSTLSATIVVDEGAMIAAAQADPTAFGPLYERYVDRVYRYVYRRVGDHAEAEDLTAQTFQQALAALPSYEWRGSPFGAWLFRIAGNLIIRYWRVRRREVSVENLERIVDNRSALDDPMEVILRQTSTEQLLEAMCLLNQDQQRALILKYSHGLKNHEVGTIMGRTEGGVKQLVHRAMIILRGAVPAAVREP